MSVDMVVGRVTILPPATTKAIHPHTAKNIPVGSFLNAQSNHVLGQGIVGGLVEAGCADRGVSAWKEGKGDVVFVEIVKALVLGVSAALIAHDCTASVTAVSADC
jgi:hypothetical protein